MYAFRAWVDNNLVKGQEYYKGYRGRGDAYLGKNETKSIVVELGVPEHVERDQALGVVRATRAHVPDVFVIKLGIAA